MIGLAAALFPARGAILALEEFDAGLNGWTDRDAAEMAVSHDAGNEWAVGTFGSQFFPTFESDAFRIASGTDFIGDYVTPGLTQIRFDLYLVNVLPSDLTFRLIDGANVFSYQFASVNNLMSWQTFTVDLAWAFGWSSSAGESAFNTALASIDAIEIQITRNTIAAQAYYFDNFETLDTPLDYGGGGDSAVPEPTSISLIAATLAVIWFGRRSRFGAVKQEAV
jgi:hypothetical protein